MRHLILTVNGKNGWSKIACAFAALLLAGPVSFASAAENSSRTNAAAPSAAKSNVDQMLDPGSPDSSHSPIELPEPRQEVKPKELQDVGVDQKRGQNIPLNLTFTNTEGEQVKLGDYFTGDKPVVLELGYLHCPNMCPMVMEGMAESMKQLDWTPSEEYEVITVSIDPKDSPIEAKKKQQEMVRKLDKPGAEDGWHYLVGDKKQIDTLASAVGFRFKKLGDRRRQFAHAANIIILSPDGEITQYLQGVRYPPQTLRLSLVDASNGDVGSLLDQALLFCCSLSTKNSKYVVTAETMMTAGGAVTLVMLGSVMGILFWRERKHRAEQRIADEQPMNDSPPKAV